MVAACMWVSREWNNELRTMVVCVWEDISRNNGDGIGLEIGTVKLDCWLAPQGGGNMEK